MAGLVGDSSTLVGELREREMGKASPPTPASKTAKPEDGGAVKKDGEVGQPLCAVLRIGRSYCQEKGACM